MCRETWSDCYCPDPVIPVRRWRQYWAGGSARPRITGTHTPAVKGKISMHLFPAIVLRAKSQIRLVQVARFSFLFPSLSFSLSCLSFLLFLSPVVFRTALLTGSFYNNSAQATENRIDWSDQPTLSLSLYLSLFHSLAEQRRRAIALESRRPDKRAVAMVTSRASWFAFVVTWFHFLSGQLLHLSNILSNHNYFNILFKGEVCNYLILYAETTSKAF